MTIPSTNPLAYQGVKAPNPPNVIQSLRSPLPSDISHDIGTIWVNEASGAVFILSIVAANVATWSAVTGGNSDINTINTLLPAGGNITIAGTANEITVSNAGSTVTLSLPAAITFPGAITATTSVTAGTTVTAGTGISSTTGDITADAGDIVATLGDITADAGNITATLGSVSAGTTVTAGTGITATTGDITATAGDIVATAGDITATAGSVTAGTTVTATLGNIEATNGNLVLGTAGNKLEITEGADASMGIATLAGGTATVLTTAITANSRVFLTRQTIGATGTDPIGLISLGAVVAGTSFDINSLDSTDASQLIATDVSEIAWIIIN